VFYEGDDVVGGGWIQSAFRQKNDKKVLTAISN
jgi:hypothetical protein